MKTLIASIALTVTLFTGCTPTPDVPVEIGEAIAQDAGQPVEILR